MKTFYQLPSIFVAANEYSCGTYGADPYNESNCTTGTGTGTGSTGGGLSDTGYDVLIPIFIGISVIIAALILLVKQFMRRRAAAKAHAQK